MSIRACKECMHMLLKSPAELRDHCMIRWHASQYVTHVQGYHALLSCSSPQIFHMALDVRDDLGQMATGSVRLYGPCCSITA